MLTHKTVFRLFSFLAMLLPSAAMAVASLSLADSPLFVGTRATPMVMLNTSRDHQLFYKAYNDYTDVDGNGKLDSYETTYLNTFDYYGYFDSYKCYTYNTTLSRFEPSGLASGLPTDAAPTLRHYCTSAWSGNFLNWVSMSRLDVMRKVLYGGYRSTDTAATTSPAAPSLTVLERASIPTDAHSWAKHYKGSDIDKLTPFTGMLASAASITGSVSSAVYPTTDFSGTVTTKKPSSPRINAVTQATVMGGEFASGNNVTVSYTGGSTTGTVSSYNSSSGLLTITTTGKSGTDPVIGASTTVTNTSISASSTATLAATGTYYAGDQLVITNGSRTTTAVVSTTTSSGSVSLSSISGSALLSSTVLTVKNETRVGISFCNTTISDGTPGSDKSESTTAPPLIRVAKGNYALWAANERWQCYWRNEKDATNSNLYKDSGIAASPVNPLKAETALSTGGVYDHVARVEVCKSSLLGQESCKQYGNNYKPAGLLQTYGEGRVPRILFGLMTPSYTLNVSGGVLRKAINKSLSGNVALDGVSADAANDEINPDTGVFNTNIAQPGGVGIIYTLNKLRIDNYQYSDGTYATCTFQQIGIVPTGTTPPANQVSEGNCSSWGNPMSELYMETMRYLSGSTATTAFTKTSGGGMARDIAVGLKQVSPWVDPITSGNYCAPLNVLVFNASVSTNDNDQVGGFNAVKGSPNAVSRTNAVGVAEGLVGKSVFIGNNGTTSNGICTAKTVANLGTLGGICPEAPSQAGTYLMAGMAYYAHVNRIRDVSGVSIDDTTDTTSLRVNTYGVALATNVPRIPITVSGKTVYLQPAYRLDLGATGVGTGTIVDFKLVSQDATKGTFYVNWEDSNFGGDYDQDVIGTLSYEILSSTQIRITTKVIAESTSQPQGFGYVISGTVRDGPHFHSGIENFNFTDPTGALGCTNCLPTDAATSVTYDVIGSASVVELKDPLYYAAKYGGFKEFTSDGKPTTISITSLPNQVIEWDSQKTDGTAGSDGLPDNYFYVNNPAQLEKSLAAAFKAISQSSGGAAVATSSTSLDTGTTVFQGVFDPGYWTGDLRAFDLKLVSGAFVFTKQWSAADKLTSSSGRIIFSANPTTNVGIPFAWGSLNTAQQSSLELVVHGTPTDQGVLDYVRGSGSKEGAGVNSFRVRDTTKLGDIVNSAPVMVNTPGNYGAISSVPIAYTGDSTYGGFAPTRSSLIYVGANDGMLHAFDASTGAGGGTERFAYVPSMVIPNLKYLVNPAYTHKYYVDGSPVAADVKLTVSGSLTWRTALTGALRAGGRGLYALDVTTPDYSTETAIKDSLLWEFTAAHDPGMGYIFERPIITQLRGGKWAVITGNGYNSTTGSAQLFIIYLDQKGAVAPKFLKIDTVVGDSGDTNGLGGVAGIDTDNDGYVDYVYGGDIKGNLWKFDLTGHVYNDATSVSFSKLAVACIDTVVSCTAARVQPITSTPALSTHPTNSKHVLVYFGTGKYFETSDATSTQQQSMYGVWDKTTDGTGAKTATTLQTRDKLLSQTITTDITSGSFRQITDLPMDWTAYSGWVENLPDSGERITGTPVVFNNGVIYNTFVPAALLCGTTAGYGWLMAVNYANGGLYGAFDINKDGTIEDTELAAGTRTTTIGGSTILTGSGGLIVAVGNSVSGDVSATGLKCVGAHCGCPGGGCGGGSGGSANRLSWREIIKPE
ncbi:MAG: Type fimbrial biosis protein PilY1 [Rhodocyclales bacterium]|nr:Type fimbrial biosis protein PilY1 [Rhodocyclales bacterium]